MGRVTPNIHHLEFGEDATWTAPAAATKWLAWRRTELQPIHNATEPDGGGSGYGGSPPTWAEIGGFDVAGGAVISAEAKDSGVTGFAGIASAAGVTIRWAALMELADGLDTEVVQIVAYDADGRAMQIDRYSVPAPSSTSASVIAAQERRLLQSLLLSRERAAATGGVRKIGGDESGPGDEYESLAVLDRRVAEVRARIAWFEAAARGNTLPRAEFW